MPEPNANANATNGSRSYFYLARLHSLLGLVPAGAFLCFHLTVNATMLAGPERYQKAVESIHQLDELGLLIPMELLFIFLPLLFHGVFGLLILLGGSVNGDRYRYLGNLRYLLQRASGIVVFVFIFFHLWQMHWLGKPFGGALFVYTSPDVPLNAAWSAAEAIRSSKLSEALYLLGVAAAVYHLANGLWTALITWGITIGPKSQKLSGVACALLGLVLMAMSMATLHAIGFYRYEESPQYRQAALQAAGEQQP